MNLRLITLGDFGVPIAWHWRSGLLKDGGSVVNSFAWWPTLVVLVLASITDLWRKRIPNWLVLPFLVAGFIVSGWLHGLEGMALLHG